LLRTLAERREQRIQTQTGVAAAMGTWSLVYVVEYHLVPLDQSADEQTVVVHEISSASKGV
jgi:hypothetical protein